MTGTVLVIDDSPEVLAVVAARLRTEGHRMFLAQNWELGLELALRERPDLILLDVEMPDVSGLDLCRRLKSDPRTAGIPIIFLTAHADVQLKVHSLDLGAADYITKPFHAAELRARVRVAMRTKRDVDELGQRARTDGLTGLANRRELDRVLAVETDAAEQNGRDLAFVLIDLDHFKQLNDEHGHAFGDRVLRDVGALVSRSVRGSDCAARYGGEELALVMPGAPTRVAAEAAGRIRSALGTLTFTVGGATVAVTASFGVAGAREVRRGRGPLRPDDLVEAADAALYAAKRAGRDRVVTHTESEGSGFHERVVAHAEADGGGIHDRVA